jgi:hypothetical protein
LISAGLDGRDERTGRALEGRQAPMCRRLEMGRKRSALPQRFIHQLLQRRFFSMLV